ncbi:phosphatase PAP2 family protein [Cupriavidus sp. L7L]|uniref:phosphatase PAP2 family protein n=1 Tax=Cupriavidus sp. L7L TaxID=2546443 RepID=UPI001055350F|nr:phosphatase PAP2 family protein [Cupriavidus sp. L7L]TDF66501.1 phosphatase PAP2 family protein [Cupriavidus sp. L7L]
MHLWNLVSHFGESAYLLPSALLIAVWLRYSHTTGSALRWLAAVMTAAGTTLISKLAFMGWGLGIPALDFTGISGHSAMAAAVFPVLLYLCIPASRPGLARFGVGCGIGLATLIGWSRLALHAHSPSEVVTGLALGLATSLAFLNWPGHGALPRSVAPLVAALVGLATLQALTGASFVGNTHRLVESTATFLSGHDHPYRRGEPKSE